MKATIILILSLFITCCGELGNEENKQAEPEKLPIKNSSTKAQSIDFETDVETIHIIVALCDNKYQGIVPVHESLGNGQNPKNNLYWGAGYGIKTYFKKSSEWRLLKQSQIDSLILERLIFKHINKDFYIVADAYNGKNIKEATENFLLSSSGIIKDTLNIDGKTIGIHGNSSLVSYIGHNGLMDFDIDEEFVNTDNKIRDIIILSCYSKNFFEFQLSNSKVNTLLWTTGLMAPEAYTIHDALSSYVKGATKEQIRMSAAKAYSKYQKCSLNTAKNLLISY